MWCDKMTQANRDIINHLTPANNASQPQWRPMTSTTKARECEKAVELILSMASHIRCRAVGAPIVKSVIDISLSIDPTSPTILRCAWYFAWSSVMASKKHQLLGFYAWINHYLLFLCSSCINSGHSERNKSAPVKEPSPPQTTSISIPSLTILCAADSRPSRVLNAAERAVPINVPP